MRRVSQISGKLPVRARVALSTGLYDIITRQGRGRFGRRKNLMRAVTTLALTHSDGYCLFGDPNPLPTPDHRHDWYPFWDTKLGKPLGEMTQRNDGATMREYLNGTAVYNPMGNDAIEIVFDEARTSRATGVRGMRHVLAGCDGDIYLRRPQ